VAGLSICVPVFCLTQSGPPAPLDEIAVIQDEVGIPNRQIFVMPEGTDAATITRRLQELYPAVLKRNWNLTSRLHIYVFGDKRGT
jgi:7-carboxy-7-deazaguanine synthase